MKSLFSSLFLLFCVVFASNAQQVEGAKSGGPQITFESMVIDYGQIPHNADGFRVFKFKNTGSAPLLITNTKGSCGCTVPKHSSEAVMPGESGEITVKYATDRIGVFTKKVYVTTNASTEQIQLTIKGEVLATAAK